MVEMTVRTCFIMQVVWDGSSHYLLWKDGAEKADQFLLNRNGGIYIGTSPALALQFARSQNEDVDAEDVSPFNFDRLWAILRSSQRGAILSKTDYNIILEGWNLIEDMGRSMKIALIPEEESRSLIQGLYEQLFKYADVLDLTTRELAGDVREKIVEIAPSLSINGDYPKLSSEKLEVVLKFLEGAWLAMRANEKWKESQ
jgi:hypothetical protein